MNIKRLGIAAVALVMIIGLVIFMTWLVGRDQPYVSKVVVTGVTPQQARDVKQRLQQVSNGNWYRLSLASIQKKLQKLPGVDQAVVSRGLPFQLKIQIKPEHLLALWNKHSALNARGEVIQLPPWCQQQCRNALPHLKGPKTKQRQLLSLYQLLQSRTKSAKLSIDSMAKSKQGVIQLHLANGLQITMANEEDLTRWRHFVTVYPKVFGHHKHLEGTQVDLRYTNGMAVHWGKQHG